MINEGKVATTKLEFLKLLTHLDQDHVKLSNIDLISLKDR